VHRGLYVECCFFISFPGTHLARAILSLDFVRHKYDYFRDTVLDSHALDTWIEQKVQCWLRCRICNYIVRPTHNCHVVVNPR
jgi:hypothetical protein